MSQQTVESRLVNYQRVSLFDGTQKLLFAVSFFISSAFLNILYSLYGPDVVLFICMLLVSLVWYYAAELPRSRFRKHPNAEWALFVLYIVESIGGSLLFIVVQFVGILLAAIFTSGKIDAVMGVIIPLALLQTIVFAAIRLELVSFNGSADRHLNSISEHVSRVIDLQYADSTRVTSARVKRLQV